MEEERYTEVQNKEKMTKNKYPISYNEFQRDVTLIYKEYSENVLREITPTCHDPMSLGA